ncbi:nucleoporin Nup37 [Procambarus clarkii]|uniref:nucleoporin Nup37 n=1 Tax=Procambarus clarkii TaxID=6728 RepID=UPI001E67590F|nr:nucleoporin Nup37-like [Procambarus clarkii]XP_045599523.1 nucleoporin Nup37-like [Procambarus clarkii]
MEVNVDPAISISTRSQVLCVEFSPFEWSRALLAVGLPTSVAVYSFKFKEEGDDSNEECEQVWEWHVSSQPVSMAWSPSSTLRAASCCLQLAVASADNKVMQLSSDLGETNTVQDILSHSDFVNSVTYNGDSGTFVASTGDDLTARVWESSSQMQIAKFLLTSPGMVVCFHPEDPDLLLVAEKKGVLRVYSVNSGCSTLFLRCPGPLLSADWSIPDPAYIVAAGAKGLTVWNVSSLQPHSDAVEVGGGERVLSVQVCRSTPGLVATHASPHVVRVTHLHSNKVPIAAHLKVVGGMSWHQNLPYLSVGSDRKILIWKIDNV